MDGEFLFSSVQSALVFAFNYSGQAAPPLLYRLGEKESHTPGKGLSGCDGAAQAGIIRREVSHIGERETGRFREAILFARYAPRYQECACKSPCCSGRKPNREWTDAISYLADHIRKTALEGCTSNGIMRREYVIRYFTHKDQRMDLSKLADRLGINRDTASAHNSKVFEYFAGKKNTDKPKLEELTSELIDMRLRELNIVG